MSEQTRTGGIRRTSARIAAEPRAGRWTSEEINKLITLWGDGLSNADLAIALGRQAGAISVKANRLGLGRKKDTVTADKRTSNPTGKIRDCMGCRKSFWSSGAGNRYCEGCKSTDLWRSGNGHSFVR